MPKKVALSLALASLLLFGADSGGEPAYTKDGHLMFPSGYRTWTFVTSGLGMTYGAEQPVARREPMFDNVFVTREAYRAFLRSGAWPEKTMFILEVRRSEEKVSISISSCGRSCRRRTSSCRASRDPFCLTIHFAKLHSVARTSSSSSPRSANRVAT